LIAPACKTRAAGWAAKRWRAERDLPPHYPVYHFHFVSLSKEESAMARTKLPAVGLAVAFVTLFTSASAFAQATRPAVPPAARPPAEPGRQTVLRPTQQEGNAEGDDQHIAAGLLIDAQAEVRLGRFAESHATSSQVKDLARHMVDDHSKSVQTLERLAGPAVADENRTRTAAGRFDWLSVKRQACDACLDWMEKEMAEKQGADFDMAFAGFQIGRHMEHICLERALRPHVSAALQQAIDDDLKMAEEHLRMARHFVDEHHAAREANTK
jgi:predicted outer membrane protein